MTPPGGLSGTGGEVRSRIEHPVIDSDGHLIEYVPLVRDFIVEDAGEDVARQFDLITHSAAGRAAFPDPRDRRQRGIHASAVWGLPTANTLDRATAMLPDLMYRRLDELGIDFAVLYPTYGLTVTALPSEELRGALARALNRYYAEAYAGYRDRLEPVAVIPTFTPEEALTELDHAVGTLGLKAVVMSGVIPRTMRPDGSVASWIDTLGHDSLHDYGPLWARCVELGVVPTFHGLGYGWGSRVSNKNYVYNHLGNFAAAQEAVCRSLIMGGAPRRYPQLRLSFLEGGVTWAVQLFADLLGHYDKRNRNAVQVFDPARFDLEEALNLFDGYATGPLRGYRDRLDQGARPFSDAGTALYGIDDFAESGIQGLDDIVNIFTRQLAFGCEADDPTNALAFDRKLLPNGTRLNAMFASDIGHWDVPDMRRVLPEAWQLVENGQLNEEDFADFAFGNVVRMLAALNPRFFDGTAVADAVRPPIDAADAGATP